MFKRALWPFLVLIFIAGSVYLQQSGSSVTVRSTGVNLLAPLQAVVTQLSSISRGFLSSLGDSRTIEQENEKLRRMVDELRRENVELWEMAATQRQTIEQKGFQQANPQWTYVSARVIAWDPSNIVRTVVLNKGKLDGVGEGMVVVSPKGLVGKVLELSDRWSKVLLLTDPRSSVNGMLQGADDRPKGILQGRPDGLLFMRYLLAESDLKKGDVVITSGMGGGFPPGLFIGWVLDVSFSDGQMFREALVRPAAGLSDLTDVMVLSNFAPLKLD